RNAIMGGELLGGVFEPFLDLIDLVTCQVPVLRLSGRPKLGMAQLCGRHELAQAWRIRLLRRLRGEDHRGHDDERGDDETTHGARKCVVAISYARSARKRARGAYPRRRVSPPRIAAGCHRAGMRWRGDSTTTRYV